MNSAARASDYAGMSLRDLTTRYLALLGSRGRDRLAGQPITSQQALDRIALSEAISRYVRDGRQVDILAALNAGATWKNVAAVLDTPEAQLRSSFRCWVVGQRALYDAMQEERPGSPPIGMSAAHGAAALQLVEGCDRGSRRPCRE